jgi:Coenzyme PQQ synthesis protein D (PqqD)
VNGTPSHATVVPMSRVEVSPSVIYRDVSGEIVLLNLQSGVYYGLDPVGSRMWHLLMERRPLDDVCAVMVEEYDVPADVLRADLSRLVDELSSKGLVTVQQGTDQT